MRVSRRSGPEAVRPIDQRGLIAIYEQLKAILAMLLFATLNRSSTRGLFVGATKG